jgi:hypothetical protein
MIQDSDIYYCGSLLPWVLWVDENQHLVSDATIAEARRIVAIQGEIYDALCQAEERLRLRVARS